MDNFAQSDIRVRQVKTLIARNKNRLWKSRLSYKPKNNEGNDKFFLPYDSIIFHQRSCAWQSYPPWVPEVV
tara:strand:- start:1546 stop:1758 length:213 start_codon:yes stop_codon:yes gene_type:complete